MIIRSPVESGKSDVLKSNGDGFIQGVEIELGYQWSPSWKSELSFSWIKGESRADARQYLRYDPCKWTKLFLSETGNHSTHADPR